MPEPLNLSVEKFKVPVKVEGYKASRFNIRTDDKDGNLLLVNTYSNKFIRVQKEDKATISDILRKPDEALHDHPAFQDLYSRGFIVDKAIDEFRRAELLHNETISSEDQLSLVLLPNEDCNFRCTYCYESFAKNFMQEWVQTGIINYLEKNLHRYRILHVNWFGGEPLTAMPIIEKLSEQIIELCRKHRVVYASGMTTNGYNLTVNNFKKLLKYRVSQFQITLDGVAETHDKTRKRMDGASTFDRIVKNLRAIRDEVKNQSFEIMIRANINREVLDNIDNYSDFLTEEFGHDPRFVLHWVPVGNWGNENVIEDANLCTHNDIVTKAMEATAKGGSYPYQRHMQAQNSVCYASKRNNFVIGSDGIIYKCTVAFDDEINHVGMLTEKGTMHLDRDRYAMWVTGHETSDPGCQKCFFRPACQGASCPLVRIKTGEAPCPSFKIHFKDYMQLISESRFNDVEELKMIEAGVNA